MKRKIPAAALLMLVLLFAFALGESCSHSWRYAKVDDSVHSRTCSKCGASEQLSHSFTTTRAPATCAKPALVTRLCSACGYSSTSEEGEPTGKHSWGEYLVTKEATCTAEGSRMRGCSLCGTTEVTAIPKSEHSFDSYTRVGENRHSRTCSVCGYKETENHESSIAKVITTARANRLGKKNITCAKCGASYMRYVSAYDGIYEMNGTDVLGNGTAYIKVNTVTLTAGTDRDLTLYTGGSLRLTASTNSKAEIYASAKTGEYTGIYLVSGNSLLTVSGSAGIEFISVAPGASMTLVCEKDASLRLGTAESKTILVRGYAKGCTVITASASGGTITGNFSVYGGDRLYVSGSGDDITIGGSASSLCTVSYGYNSKTKAVSAKSADPSVNITLCTADGTPSLTSADGVLKDRISDTPFYFTVSGSFGSYPTPVISAEAVMDTETAPVIETDADVPAVGDEGGNEEPAAAESGFIGPYTVLTDRVSESPDIRVKIEGGRYMVTVSSVPAGYTFSSITFIQNYTYPGQHRLISYGADASFPIENADSTVSAVVTFIKGGKTVTCPAGSYGYRAN